MPTAAPRPAFACYSSIRAICAMPSPPPPNRRSISPFSQCLISPARSAQTTPIPSTRPPPSLSHYRAPQRCILRSSAPSAKACSCCSTISARKGRENVQPDPSDNNRIFPGDITPYNPRICATTLSSPHIATQVLPNISIDENPLPLTAEPRQTQRKKLPHTPASTWCPTARLP